MATATAPFDPIVKEFERVRKRKRVAVKSTCDVIDSMLKALSKCRSDAVELDDLGMIGDRFKVLKKELDEGTTTVKKHNKEVASSLSKYGKSIDKVFETNLTKISQSTVFQDKQECLNQSIIEHFLREGRWSLGEGFMNGTGIKVDESRLHQFKLTRSILEALRHRDLAPALRWTTENRGPLIAQRSRLEFLLHRLAFISLLIRGERLAAIDYSKQHFERFAAAEMKEIRRLLGSLVFIKRLEHSVYASLKDEGNWTQVSQLCARECARQMGLSQESPLAVCINAGCTATPKLLKLASKLAVVSNKDDILASKELPVEINLGTERFYHSVFTCPVSRETACNKNPPMRLPCGHVLCQDSIKKIAKGSRRLFKCTYCPQEQTINEATVLRF
eukprot:m.16727 g.16727  ORF g.16727 m.16727 type:complete len:390 (+) comp11171_c0_seq1:241-1410(+)